MRRNFVLKKLPDHHRRIDLKEKLESRNATTCTIVLVEKSDPNTSRPVLLMSRW
jgi:hypothetical protein